MNGLYTVRHVQIKCMQFLHFLQSTFVSLYDQLKSTQLRSDGVCPRQCEPPGLNNLLQSHSSAVAGIWSQTGMQLCCNVGSDSWGPRPLERLISISPGAQCS